MTNNNNKNKNKNKNKQTGTRKIKRQITRLINRTQRVSLRKGLSLKTSNAPISKSYSLSMPQAKINTTRQGIRIVHTEMMVSAATNLQQKISFNPGSISFPFLRGLAMNYESYRVNGIELNYVPMAPTTAKGMTSAVADYDPLDYTTNLIPTPELMQKQGFVSGNVWKPLKFKLDLSRISYQGNKLYIRKTTPSLTDRTTDCCFFIITQFGNDATPVQDFGSWFITYDISLITAEYSPLSMESSLNSWIEYAAYLANLGYTGADAIKFVEGSYAALKGLYKLYNYFNESPVGPAEVWNFIQGVFRRNELDETTVEAGEVVLNNNQFFMGNRATVRALHLRYGLTGTADVFNAQSNYNWINPKIECSGIDVYFSHGCSLKQEFIDATTKRIMGTGLGCYMDVYLVFRTTQGRFEINLQTPSVFTAVGEHKAIFNLRAEEVDLDLLNLNGLTKVTSTQTSALEGCLFVVEDYEPQVPDTIIPAQNLSLAVSVMNGNQIQPENTGKEIMNSIYDQISTSAPIKSIRTTNGEVSPRTQQIINLKDKLDKMQLKPHKVELTQTSNNINNL